MKVGNWSRIRLAGERIIKRGIYDMKRKLVLVQQINMEILSNL